MRQSRFNESQIVKILKEVAAGQRLGIYAGNTTRNDLMSLSET